MVGYAHYCLMLGCYQRIESNALAITGQINLWHWCVSHDWATANSMVSIWTFRKGGHVLFKRINHRGGLPSEHHAMIFLVPNILCESAKPARPRTTSFRLTSQASAASGLNHEGQPDNKAQTWNGPCFLRASPSGTRVGHFNFVLLHTRICSWDVRAIGHDTWAPSGDL